jgi:hypothetical protein
MKSLYRLIDEQTMTQILAKRWWVDPRVAYLYKRDADMEIINP